jgi:hypothetical protein
MWKNEHWLDIEQENCHVVMLWRVYTGMIYDECRRRMRGFDNNKKELYIYRSARKR